MPARRGKEDASAKIRPTLQDVAHRADVSTATVSRCLSAPGKVRPAVRERVSAAIAELGYTPDGSARALVSRRTNTIGAVVPTLDNAIFAGMIQSLQRVLNARGRSLLLSATDYVSESEYGQIENLLMRGVDGLLLTGEAHDPMVDALLKRRGIRYVCTYVHRSSSSHPTIGFDNRLAMAKIVGYLHDLGHRSFAMIAGVAKGNDRASERIEGVRAALRSRGLSISADHILERPYTIAAARDAMRRLFEGSDRPTAVLCGNDILGIGALFEAAALGLKMPQDVSITGFDDLDIAKEVSPALTTVHAPRIEMGKLAAEYLLDDSPPDKAPRHVELPTELVVRNSTGPAPSRRNKP